MDSGYYKGASVIIFKDNQVVFQKYYGNDGEQTVTYIASAGKWLGAAVIAAVVDEGKLSWNDPVRKWIPAFTDLKGDATLRQLLSHTSGYPDYQPKSHHPDDYHTCQESVDSLLALPADTVPGALFHYGGLAMQVAGRMAELATGKDWETLFQEKIAEPLHLSLTHFTPVDPGHTPMIAGGARASLSDYANFLNMMANNGLFEGKCVLSMQAIEELQNDQIGRANVPPDPFPLYARASKHRGIYGLGEWREELDAHGKPLLLSSPSWAGTYPWIDLKYNVYGLLLAHVSKGGNDFNAFLASPVLPLMTRDVIDRAKATDVKKGFVELKGAKLYYEELGQGTPIIFIHGHSLDNTMWNTQFREFAKNHRVIRYDCRGYGQSTQPREDQPFMHAEDLVALMDKLKIKKAHLVGLSMGGFITLDMLILHPDRILSATMANGNLFQRPGPNQPWSAREIQKRRLEIAELSKKGIDSYKREWFNDLMASGGSMKERMRNPLWKMIYEWDAWQPLHVEPRSLLGYSVIEKLQKNPVKNIRILVLEGRKRGQKIKTPQIMDYLPKAKLQYLEDAGHLMNMEQPEAFNAAVRAFISK